MGRPVCRGGCGHGKCEKSCVRGRCVNECVCDQGWTGKHCRQDFNDCAARPCDHRCVNIPGGYKCMCELGFSLDQNDKKSCHRTKSLCNLKNCEMDCKETYGRAVCSCPKPGLNLASDGIHCIDRDECNGSIGLCRAREQCINTYGGYRCDCRKGYQKLRKNGIQSTECSDLDECKDGVHTCSERQICRNIEGGYQCIDKESLVNPVALRTLNTYDYKDGVKIDYDYSDDIDDSRGDFDVKKRH